MSEIGLSSNSLKDEHLKIKEVIESSDTLKKKTKGMTGFAIEKFSNYYFGIEKMANDLRETISMTNGLIQNTRSYINDILKEKNISENDLNNIAFVKNDLIEKLERAKLKYEDIGLETLQDAFFADTFGAIYIRMKENPKYTNTDSLRYLTNFQNNTDYILHNVKQIPSLVKSAIHYINLIQV